MKREPHSLTLFFWNEETTLGVLEQLPDQMNAGTLVVIPQDVRGPLTLRTSVNGHNLADLCASGWCWSLLFGQLLAGNDPNDIHG